MKPNDETITIQDLIERGCIEILKDISVPIRYKETVHVPVEQVLGNLQVVLAAVNGLVNKCNELANENNQLKTVKEVELVEEEAEEADTEPEPANE